MDQLSRCIRCGDVIGIYEPLVLLQDSHMRETSLAAEPELAQAPGERYHRACFAAAQARDQASANGPPS